MSGRRPRRVLVIRACVDNDALRSPCDIDRATTTIYLQFTCCN